MGKNLVNQKENII